MAYIQTPALTKSQFFKVKIVHLPTSPQGKENFVHFNGWITEFQDQFVSNWNTQNVYGRMDQLATFDNTTRSITMGFDVVSANITEAIDNLLQVNRLIEFLYPVYESGKREQQNVLKAAPLIGLQWTNLASQPSDGTPLIGYLGPVTYAPDMGEGGFIPKARGGSGRLLGVEVSNQTMSSYISADRTGLEMETSFKVTDRQIGDPRDGLRNTSFSGIQTRATDSGYNRPEGFGQRPERKPSTSVSYIPKKLNISLNFTVLHTHLTGWYVNEAGDYVFGSDRISGRFPNAHMARYRQKEQVRVPTSTTGSVTTPAGGEPAEFVHVGQRDILRGSK